VPERKKGKKADKEGLGPHEHPAMEHLLVQQTDAYTQMLHRMQAAILNMLKTPRK
jgi:hypothetical protein